MKVKGRSRKGAIRDREEEAGGRIRDEAPQKPGNLETLGDQAGPGRRASARSGRGRPSLSCTPGPGRPARPRPRAPGAGPQERDPMDRSGPAPSRADWPPPHWPRLISKFSGEQRRTRSRRVRPGSSACAGRRGRGRRRRRAARPSAPEQDFGSGGRRARRARPARAPGAPRAGRAPSTPEAHARRLACAAAGEGAGSAWPRLLI